MRLILRLLNMGTLGLCVIAIRPNNVESHSQVVTSIKFQLSTRIRVCQLNAESAN